MFSRKPSWAVVVAMAGFVVYAPAARAQLVFKPTLKFSPSLGLYLPFSGYIINEPQRGTPPVPALSKRQIHTGILYGRLSYWPKRRVGVEATGAWGRGLVAIR